MQKVNDRSGKLLKAEGAFHLHAMQEPDRKSVLIGVLYIAVVVRMRSTLPDSIAVGRSLQVDVRHMYTWLPSLRYSIFRTTTLATFRMCGR